MKRAYVEVIIVFILFALAAYIQYQIAHINSHHYHRDTEVPECETPSQPVPDTPPKITNADVEGLVRETFQDNPIMIEVARCESTFRHFKRDGTVLQGHVDPDDTGVMQINKRYHEETAEAMGLDLDDIHDNLTYARHLFDAQGTQPWYPSRECWGEHLASA